MSDVTQKDCEESAERFDVYWNSGLDQVTGLDLSGYPGRQGDTLVVETTYFRGDVSERATIDWPVLISADAKVRERFTRLAQDELF